MLLPFLEFVGGVLLMTLHPTHMTSMIEKLIHSGIPRTLVYLLNVVIFFVAIHLVIDPVIPGHGILQVHGSWPTQYSREDIAVEIAPVEFNGHINQAKSKTCYLTLKDGRCYVLIQFELGEQLVYYHAYNRARPDSPFDEGFTSVSPYVRLGLLEKHIFLRHPE